MSPQETLAQAAQEDSKKSRQVKLAWGAVKTTQEFWIGSVAILEEFVEIVFISPWKICILKSFLLPPLKCWWNAWCEDFKVVLSGLLGRSHVAPVVITCHENWPCWKLALHRFIWSFLMYLHFQDFYTVGFCDFVKRVVFHSGRPC